MKRRIRNGGNLVTGNHKNGLLGATAIILGLGAVGFAGLNASALNYMKNVDVQFTFNDTITVSVSNPNLVISDLSHGTASDSNVITVNVLSNNPYGYTLNSTVGSSTSPYSSYGRNLTHSTITTGNYTLLC